MFDHADLVDRSQKSAIDDVRVAADDELVAAVVDVELSIRALSAASGHLLAELDARGVCEEQFGQSTGAWFAHRLSEPVGTSRARVRRATRLRTQFETVDAALTSGRVGNAHVEVLDRAANPRVSEQIAELQDELLDLADAASFERFRVEVRGLADELDQDGGHDPDRMIDRNRLSIRTNGDRTDLRGELYGELAASVREVLDRATDALWRDAIRDHDTTAGSLPVPGRATLAALALGEICRRSVAADAATTSGPVTDLTLVWRDDEPDRVRTLDGHALPTAECACRMCDSAISFLELDADEVPLRLGRQQRLASRAQRRANHVRDGGCVFPGCDAPASWTDQHHVTWWEHDGPTDASNLASLCRRHHGITHRTGWEMHTTPDQWFWWQTPTGHTFWSQRHGRQRAGPIPTE